MTLLTRSTALLGGASLRVEFEVERLEARRMLSVTWQGPQETPEYRHVPGSCGCGSCGAGGSQNAYPLVQGVPAEVARGAEVLVERDAAGGALLRDGAGEFYFDPAPAVFAAEADAAYEAERQDRVANGGSSGVGGVGRSAGLPTQPGWSSNPSSPYKVFLDFDGHVVSGTGWNGLNNGRAIHAQPFSIDGDVFGFSATEVSRMREIWQRVAEDFGPFNLDVTTVEPASSSFAAGGRAVRVVISTDVDSVAMGGTGNRWFSNAGGVAYLDSWRWQGDTPVWVFANNLANGNAKYVAEAASHEVGHAFGLRHDGRVGGEEYFGGHGDWAPIMGLSYNRPVTQWSRGEYAGANNLEDDVAVIGAWWNNAGFRADDHGNTRGSATTVSPVVAGSQTLLFRESGIIGTRTDVDVFRLDLRQGGGTLSGRVNSGLADGTPYSANNLRTWAWLEDESGRGVSWPRRLDAGRQLDVVFAGTSLPAGVYYLHVEGVGAGNPQTNGYSPYGSLGAYNLDLRYDVTAPPPPVTTAFRETSGLVEIEAADPTGRGPDRANPWVVYADASALGGRAIVSSPNTDFNSRDNLTGHRLDYAVEFERAGTSHVWVRMAGDTNRDDSVHVGLNGQAATLGGFGLHPPRQDGRWDWVDTSPDLGRRVTVSVPSAGRHTLNLWVREDGTKVDEIRLARDPAYRPGGTTPPPPPPPVQDPNAFAETNGRVFMEAEAFTGTSGPRGGNAWQVVNRTGASGRVVQALPDVDNNTRDNLTGPRLDYAVNFAQAGTLWAWVRLADATGDGRGNSVHLGLNGRAATLGMWGLEQSGTALAWSSGGPGIGRVRLEVPSPGVHTVNLWMREDGTPVDSILLMRDVNFRPSGVTPGPFVASTPSAALFAETPLPGVGTLSLLDDDDNDDQA